MFRIPIPGKDPMTALFPPSFPPQDERKAAAGFSGDSGFSHFLLFVPFSRMRICWITPFSDGSQ